MNPVERSHRAVGRINRAARWNVLPADPRTAELAAGLKVSPLVASVLLNRGICGVDEATRFLQPGLKDLHDPSLLAGLERASERIAGAIKSGEKIVIYGDYDVDGITAVSILWHAIKTLGGTVEYYIPHRLEEGYGLNADAVAAICDGGAKLIVTVDCGVTAIGPAAVAASRGVDLIISDHHEWKERADGTPDLPGAYAVVHPRLPRADGAAYPNPHLCGAGVAFKLAWGIGKAVVGADRVGPTFRDFLIDAIALAGLGTIADVVPLVGENRVIAAKGLAGLPWSKMTGILALIASANLTGKPLDAYHVGFRLGPRLNACGRMGHAKLAAEMLTDASADRAYEIAVFLEAQNRERQETERKILEQAIEQAESLGCDRDDCRAVVLGSEGWHPGVVGIVASRLVERFGRPAVMIGLTNGHGAGSGRSIAGFHLARALESCTSLLETHGGHEMAAGLRLKTENLPAFREAFCAYAMQEITAEQMVPEITLEVTAELRQVTQAMVKDLSRVGPFGHANERPLMYVPGVTVGAPPRRVGKTALHAQMFVRQGSVTAKAIVFNADSRYDALSAGDVVDLAVDAKLNEFQGRVTVELEVADIRPAAR
jgi:single-stranded-DNA-specific exonuclease